MDRPWNRTASALLGAVAGACVYAMRRADPDLWGYLSYGRLFVQQGGPVDWDPFSYTCANCRWIYFEYLSQVSIWLAYWSAGPLGLILLKCVLGGVAAFFVLRTLRSIEPRPLLWLPIYLLALGMVPRFFLFRPQLYTFAFFAFFVDTVLRYLAGGHTRLWLLVPATAIWANLHGGFLAGLGMIGLAALLSAAQAANRGAGVRGALASGRDLWLALIGAFAASFLNPQGWRLWEYLLTELSHDTNRRYIAEWMPLSFARDPWSAALTLLLLTVFLVISALAWQRRSSPLGVHSWQWLAASAPLVLMTIQSVRHVPILTIWLSPVLVLLLGGAYSAPTVPLRRFWAVVSVVFAVPALLTLWLVVTDPAPNIGIPGGTLGRTAPFGAVEFLKRSGLTGRLCLPLWWGSYATWELDPRVKVSMDGRNVSLYPRAMVRANLEFYRRGDGAQDQLGLETADFLLMPSDAPALARVRHDSRWRRLFEDPDCVLFGRAEAELPSGLLDSVPIDAPSSSGPGFLR